MNTLKGLPVKSFAQWYQVNISNRFQEYIVDFKEGNTESPLIEPGIKEATVPLRFVVAPKDLTCTLTQAYRVYKEYGGEVNIAKLYDPEAGHESFIMAMDKPEFLAQLRTELTSTEYSAGVAMSATSAMAAILTAMSF